MQVGEIFSRKKSGHPGGQRLRYLQDIIGNYWGANPLALIWVGYVYVGQGDI